MKNILKVLALTAFVLLTTLGYSQEKEKSDKVARQKMSREKREKIDSARTAFITERLSLTPAQSEKFFPLYKEYNEKRKGIRKELATLKSQSGNLTATDEQLKADINKMLELRQREVNVDKEYYEKFQKVISIRQLAELYHSESLFMRELIKSYRGDRGHHSKK